MLVLVRLWLRFCEKREKKAKLTYDRHGDLKQTVSLSALNSGGAVGTLSLFLGGLFTFLGIVFISLDLFQGGKGSETGGGDSRLAPPGQRRATRVPLTSADAAEDDEDEELGAGGDARGASRSPASRSSSYGSADSDNASSSAAVAASAGAAPSSSLEDVILDGVGGLDGGEQGVAAAAARPYPWLLQHESGLSDESFLPGTLLLGLSKSREMIWVAAPNLTQRKSNATQRNATQRNTTQHNTP